MSKKDYIATARELHNLWFAMVKEHSGEAPLNEVHIVFNACVAAIADVFAADNPRFDYARFKDAVYEGSK